MEDYSVIAQQVQGLVGAYNAARNRVAELEAELATRREDIRRLEKSVKELQQGKGR